MYSKADFSEALIRVYNAAYSSNSWSDALDACKGMTACKHTVLYCIPLNDEITFSTQGGSASLASINDKFIEYNKIFNQSGNSSYDGVGAKYMAKSEIGKPVLDTDIWDIEWLRNRPEVKFIMEFGIFRKMYVNLSSDPLVNSGYMYWYGNSVDEIPPADIQTANLISPHLSKAMEIARWADSLRRKYSVVLSALDHIELGVCLADHRGNIFLQNRHARDLISEKDGLWINRESHVSARNADITAQIRDAISEVSKTSHGKGATNSVEIAIPRLSSENPLLVIASPLRDAEMELERNISGCLLTIVDTDRTRDLRIDVFGDAYGFTPTEIIVAKHLVSGLTTPQLGEEIGVATSTAQTHVKSIYQKTGSNNRVNFVWRAIQFSPPIL